MVLHLNFVVCHTQLLFQNPVSHCLKDHEVILMKSACSEIGEKGLYSSLPFTLSVRGM